MGENYMAKAVDLEKNKLKVSQSKISDKLNIDYPKEKINKNNLLINPGSEFVWTPAMSVNENTIDQQHKILLFEINELIKEASMGQEMDKIRHTFNFLGKYIKQHLSYEEDYMLKLEYPGLKEHQVQHHSFVKFYTDLKIDFNKIYKPDYIKREDLSALINKARKFLGDWLVNHIFISDHKYAEYAKSKPKIVPLATSDNKLNKSMKRDIPAKKDIINEVKTEIKPQQESNNKKSTKPQEINQETISPVFDITAIKKQIEAELKSGKIRKSEDQTKEQTNLKLLIENKIKKNAFAAKKYVKTGVPGFDDLFDKGIPQGYSILIAGGAGSGKTILCLQTLINKANEGKKCFYMSFEESEARLVEHMEEFGWTAKKLIKKGLLKIQRMNPFDITRNVNALLAKQKGELLIDVDPVILPRDFKPNFVVIDSLTAIASAFTGKEDSYRIYIEQLFRFFEKLGSTNLLITETQQIPEIFSQSGVEEFLADGVVVFYNFKRGDVREKGLEVLKMRGENHQRKIVAMTISDTGIIVYPEQEVFGNTE